MGAPTMHDKPPAVYVHHALVGECDLERMTVAIGQLSYRVISVQPASWENPPQKFWITAAKIENFLQRLEEEEKKNMRMRETFGPYVNPVKSYEYYKTT